MTKLLLLTALFFAPQFTVPSHTWSGGAPPPSCTAPTIDHRWAAYNPANTCGAGSVACSNGEDIQKLADLAGSADISASPGAAIWAAGEVNGQPGLSFVGDSYLLMGSGIATPGTTTVYAFVKPGTTSGILPIFGTTTGSNGLEYRINNGKQEVLNAGLAVLAAGTTTLSTTSYTLIYAVVTGTSVNLFVCSSGSCASDGTATFGAITFAHAVDVLGGSGGDPLFNGHILEVGVGAGTVTGIDAWGVCKYNVG